MSDNGWVCSYRKIWKNKFFLGNGMRVAIWHWLLHHAAWEDTTFKIGTAEIDLNRGEVCFSQQQISDDTGATRKQVRDVIDFLLATGSAAKIGANERAKDGASVRANARTVLLIVKYNEYQGWSKRGANEPAKDRATDGPTKEQGKQLTHTPPSEEAAEPPFPVSPITSSLWEKGKPYLARYGVPNPGAVIGRWLRDYNGDALRILAAFDAAMKAGTHEPIPYITAILEGSNGRGHSASRAADERFASTLEQIARTAGLGET